METITDLLDMMPDETRDVGPYRVTLFYDPCMDPPWEEYDQPLVILSTDPFRIDQRASCARAVAEWGATPEDAPSVVAQAFEYCQRWLASEWYWTDVTLHARCECCGEWRIVDSLGGVESDAEDYIWGEIVPNMIANYEHETGV